MNTDDDNAVAVDGDPNTIEGIEKKRADRKALLEAKRLEQRRIDLVEVDKLEELHGDHAIVVVKFDRYAPGLPTLIALALPEKAVAKRYRDRLKPKGDGTPPDAVAAALELGASCLRYPDHPTYTKLCEIFGNLSVDAAVAAIKASEGKAVDEGKG